MTTFTGTQGVTTYTAIALRSGIKLYAKTGIKPNRMWTATAMLQTAARITGHTYKRGQFEQAIKDLTCWIEANGTAG